MTATTWIGTSWKVNKLLAESQGRAAWNVEGCLAVVDLAAEHREGQPAGPSATPTAQDDDHRRS